MNGFNIVLVIAIILFARLAVRLYNLHKKFKQEQKDEANDSNNNPVPPHS